MWLSDFDHGIVDGARWTASSILQTASRVTQNGVQNKKHPVIKVLWVEILCWWPRSEENGPGWQEGYGNSNSQFLQPWGTEKHLKTHNVLNLEADVSQQQNTTLGSTNVSQRQESEGSVSAGSPKLDRWILGKDQVAFWFCWRYAVPFSCVTWLKTGNIVIKWLVSTKTPEFAFGQLNSSFLY